MKELPPELISTRPLDGEAAGAARGDGPGSIGRYRVLGRLGAGGMGEVFRARDAELDREVAIKLVRGDRRGAEATARLTREARAMARLDHPSVVTVFEVGVTGGDVFVAMELIDGVTLTRWLDERPRPWPELLAMFCQAGAGLAAAHRAGLVHRDFKPDNVLVDREGRARVTDFGLAALQGDGAAGGASSSDGSPELTTTGTVMGTPLYMSPEQHRGEIADARSDQFAFCVALHEALFGERPFRGDSAEELRDQVLAGTLAPAAASSKRPGWLRAAIARGLARDASARWPSMDALLGELTRDRGAARRRLMIGAAVVAAASLAAGGAWLVWGHGGTADPCAQAGAEIRTTWNADVRAALDRSFAASGRSYAAETARRVADDAEAWATSWTAAHQASCRATHVRREQSAQAADLRSTCLARARTTFAAQLSSWTQGGDRAAAVVDRAIAAAARLPDVAACADPAALEAVVMLPVEPAQRAAIETAQAEADALRASVTLGTVDDGVARARALSERAETLGHPPLLVDALGVLALAQGGAGAFADATATLRRRIQTAATVRDHDAEAESWSELIYVIGYEQLRFDEALALREAGEAALHRAGGGARIEARLLYRVGLVQGRKGDVPGALDSLRRAAARVADDDVELSTSVAMALAEWLGTSGDFDGALQVIERARVRAAAALGADHPAVTRLIASSALAHYGRGDLTAAAAVLRQALASMERVQGNDVDVATLHNNLGAILLEIDAADEQGEAMRETELALAAYRKVTPLPAVDIANTLNNLAHLHAGHGRLAETLATAAESLSILRTALGDAHVDVARLRATLAQAIANAGDLPTALRYLDDALPALAAAGPEALNPYTRAVHLRGDIYLAKRDLAAARRDHDRALALAATITGDGGATLLELTGLVGGRWLEASQPRIALPYLRRAVALGDATPDHADAPLMRFALGRALIESGTDRAAGWTLVHAARADLFAAAHPATPEVDAWIASRPDRR